MQKKPISITKIARLQEIFSDKQWPIEEAFNDEVFERFCKMLETMNEEQCELMISLTEEFCWIREADYLKRFSESFDLFMNSRANQQERIFICPLLPEEDFGKPKSSMALYYRIRGCITAIQKKYSDNYIAIIDSPEKIPFNSIKNGLICLIDDFVGTGKTVEASAEYLLERGMSKEDFCIVSIAAMTFGVNDLKEKGYEVFSAITMRKGISETENAEEKAIIMKSIEDSIKVKDNYRFGYGSSESLIKLLRTPNNTFPVYWLNNKRNCAPFPR